MAIRPGSCEHCKYAGIGIVGCDYFEITGKVRASKGKIETVEGCTHYKKGKREPIIKTPLPNQTKKDGRAKKKKIDRRRFLYRVYDVKTGELVVGGTSEHCAERLGIEMHSFNGLVNRSNKGTTKKYRVESSRITEGDAEE